MNPESVHSTYRSKLRLTDHLWPRSSNEKTSSMFQCQTQGRQPRAFTLNFVISKQPERSESSDKADQAMSRRNVNAKCLFPIVSIKKIRPTYKSRWSSTSPTRRTQKPDEISWKSLKPSRPIRFRLLQVALRPSWDAKLLPGICWKTSHAPSKSRQPQPTLESQKPPNAHWAHKLL